MHVSTRTFFSLLWVVLSSTVLWIGCSSDSDNSTNPPAAGFMWTILDEDSVQMQFADLPKITVEGEETIRLNEFVTTSLVPEYVDDDSVHYDSRVLYAYQIIGEDGFSASGDRGYADNTWAHLNLGYLLTSNRRVIFPDDSIDLPGAYNVQGALYFVLHRKFDLLRPAEVAPDSHAFVELKAVTPVSVTNPDGLPESALPLADFVTRILVNPQDFQYDMAALDGFGPTSAMTWEQMQTGYWLLTSERTMFTDTTLVGGRYRLRMLESLVIVP